MSAFISSTPSGIDKETADSASREVMAFTQENNPGLVTSTWPRPFYPVSHTSKTKAITDQYIQGVGPIHAAEVLGVEPSQVKVYGEPSVIVYVKFTSPSSLSIGKTTSGKAISIISLGDLDHNRGLPGIGDPPEFPKLSSGQVLQASGDARQTFNANPERVDPGTAILIIWTR